MKNSERIIFTETKLSDEKRVFKKSVTTFCNLILKGNNFCWKINELKLLFFLERNKEAFEKLNKERKAVQILIKKIFETILLSFYFYWHFT